MMTFQDFLAQISSGEDSCRQFKSDVRNGDSLASDYCKRINDFSCEINNLAFFIILKFNTRRVI